MKLLCFNDYRIGVLRGSGLVDISSVAGIIPHGSPRDLMPALIERFGELKPGILKAMDTGPVISIDSVKILPPLPRPADIDCMAVNYIEDPSRPEPAPINAFQKSPNAIIGDGDTMVLPDVPATIFEGEAELAVVIGTRASNVRASDAMKYVFGYVNFNDGSARGLGVAGNLFYQMKSRDTFAPIGPYIVTADDVPDPNNLQVRLWNNGILMQDYNTRDMAHKIPRCIEWISSIHTLEPGDIIATGTNHKGLNPFQDGDRIEMETEGLGRLHFRVRDDLKRTWARQTRFQRQQQHLEGTTPQLTGKYAPGGAK
jgi:2-keto-4-pentenoate hydratase/2-oxohepta-3-ene-1,7-dioic acid hydratase in catechol pathway